MKNKSFTHFFITLTSLVFLMAVAQGENGKLKKLAVEIKKLNSEEFLKKYWKKRNTVPTIVNDNLDKNNRVDLNNKYYYISYYKCFKVEPIISDFDEEPANPNEESAGLEFKRTKECAKDSNYSYSNRFLIYYQGEITNEKLKSIATKVNIYPRVTIHDLLTINSFKAELTSRVVDIDSVAELRLTYNIYCPGKKNEVYEILLIPESYQEQLDFVTKYNYKLPDDIMQIISTFKCRKDR